MIKSKDKESPSFFYEDTHEGDVVGIDEAGCGPWAGPVVAAAAMIEDRKSFEKQFGQDVNDSKKLSAKQRLRLFELFLQTPYIHLATGLASVEEIDAHNIAEATKSAMQRAFLKLLRARDKDYFPVVALIDGIRRPDLACPVSLLIKGDQKSFSIAVASIVAKVTRDCIMTELHARFPQYGWERNAGYGTSLHQEALYLYGVTPYHRRSFAPIKRILEGT